MKKLKLNKQIIRNLSRLELHAINGGMIHQSQVTNETGLCCGTAWCNTREDRDCWGTYNGCPG